MTAASESLPIHGIGLGLRMGLSQDLFEHRPDEVRWLEIHPENYVQRGGPFRRILDEAREDWPIGAHGLTLCFGTLNPFERDYVSGLKALLDRVNAPWYSDHLCFGGIPNAHLHDLVPLPRVDEAVELAARRIAELQDALERPVALENVSFYAETDHEQISEVEFVNAVLDLADCKLLLDVNNVYVNSRNHDFDPRAYIDAIDPRRVVQVHMAGHFTRPDGLIIDTHGEAICGDVYDLFEHTLRHLGHVPVLLERDGNYPAFDELMTEVRRLRDIYDDVLGPPSGGAS